MSRTVVWKNGALVVVFSFLSFQCGLSYSELDEPSSRFQSASCCAFNSTNCIDCTTSAHCCNFSIDIVRKDLGLCCATPGACCGISCCLEDEECCLGESGIVSATCCKAGHCSKNEGKCEPTKSKDTVLIVVLLAASLVAVPLCTCCWVRVCTACKRYRRSRNNPSGAIAVNQHQMYLPINNVDAEGFPIGVSAALLEKFPIMVFQEDMHMPSKEEEVNETTKLIVSEEYSEHMCSICLDMYRKEDRLRLLPCSHIFHANCIDLWLKRSTFCPLCKTELLHFEFTMQ